jgi:hypothetical protein
MLNNVDVEAGTKRLPAGFLSRAILDLLDLEVRSLRMFAMQQRSRDPNFIRDLDLSFRRSCHSGPGAREADARATRIPSY